MKLPNLPDKLDIMWFKRKKSTQKVEQTQTHTNQSQDESLVLLFERGSFSAVRLSHTAGTIVLDNPQNFEWNSNDLGQQLAQLKIQFPHIEKVSVVLGQDLGVVTSIILDDSPQIEAKAEGKAREIFSTAFNALAIDYSFVSHNQQATLVKMFAVRQSFLELLGTALEQAHFEVEAIKPLSDVLAGQVDSSQGTDCVLWGETYLYAVIVNQDQVISAETIQSDNIYKSIESLISSVESRFNTNIQTVYMASSKLDKKKLSKANNVEEVELNPFSDSVDPNQEFGMGEIFTESEIEETDVGEEPDAQIADETNPKSVIIDEAKPAAPKPPLALVNNDTQESMESVTQQSSRSNAKLVAIIVTVVVVLVGMVIGGFFVYQNAMSEANQPPEIVVTEEPIATPLPDSTPDSESTDSGQLQPETEIDVATLLVEVLNGSGIPGAAGDLASDLETAGFEDIDTGNADQYDYEETVVSVKPGQDEVYTLVLEAIQDNYEVIQGDDLDEDSDFDVQVIVGQN